MATYIIGTDGESASKAIANLLEDKIREHDHARAVYASASETSEAREALEIIEERLAPITSVDTSIVDPGQEGGPVRALVQEADHVDADQMVVGLRRHSRTERIIMGSVSHSLIENVTIPILLVPLPEYQPSDD